MTREATPEAQRTTGRRRYLTGSSGRAFSPTEPMLHKVSWLGTSSLSGEFWRATETELQDASWLDASSPSGEFWGSRPSACAADRPDAPAPVLLVSSLVVPMCVLLEPMERGPF